MRNATLDGNIQFQVKDQETQSDHNYVRIVLQATPSTIKSTRFRTKYGNHAKFRALLSNQLNKLKIANINSPAALDDYTTRLIGIIQECCAKAYRKKYHKQQRNFTWWTPQLVAQRNKLRAMKKRLKGEEPTATQRTLLSRVKYRRQLLQTRFEAEGLLPRNGDLL